MFTETDIHDYASLYTSEEPDVLKELNRETHVKMIYPRMLSGHLQGRLLSMISKMIQPIRILEIGTYTGYSAICLSEGLQKNGQIHCIEINPELEEIIQKYVEKSGIRSKFKLHIGDAIHIIPTLKENYDLVFIDADKEQYLQYYHLIFNKVKKGGYIIADNVIWNGKVLLETKKTDKETEGIKNFNEFIKNDKRVENILLPFRDGIMIIKKI